MPQARLEPLLLVLAPAAAALLVAAAAIILVLAKGSVDALAQGGAGFLASSEWSPSEEERGSYGVLAPLAGTLVVAGIASAIAAYLAVAVAVYLYEYAPRRVREAVELSLYSMAALPTIVFGMWGLSTAAPIIRQSGLTLLCARGSPTGQSFFTAGLVVGLMIAPYAAAIVSEAYRAVPFTYVEALHSLGARGFERARVLLGMVKGSVLAAALLSFGRAVGETTVVALTVGSAVNMPLCPFEPGHTVSSLIASQFGNAYLYPGMESVLLTAALVMVLVSSASTTLGLKLARAAVRKAQGGEA
ncbi:MAG: ABC transporter permease subunit [Thermofilum sp.]